MTDDQDGQTQAQNDARFAAVLARLDAFRAPSIWQIAGIAAATIAATFAILACAAARFDGAASGLLDRMQEEQAARFAAQDAKLDRILEAISARDRTDAQGRF